MFFTYFTNTLTLGNLVLVPLLLFHYIYDYYYFAVMLPCKQQDLYRIIILQARNFKRCFILHDLAEFICESVIVAAPMIVL